MNKNVGVAKRIAASCVVATGIAVLWFVVARWLSLIGQTLLPETRASFETLHVAVDGTPVISIYSSSRNTIGGNLLTSQRTLDGKPWPLEYENWLQSAYFPKPYEPPGVVETPLPWNEGYGRTAGATDGKLMPTAWYLIRDDEKTGGVYLAGYDSISKTCVGYIGRDGFRGSKPSAGEQFIVPKSTIEDGFEYVAGNPHLAHRALVRNGQILRDRPWEWTVGLLGVNDYWEIDLRQRTVRSRARFDDAISIGGISLNQATFDQIPNSSPAVTAVPAPSDADKKKANPADEQQANGKNVEPQTEGLSVVREPDRMVFWSGTMRKRKEFILPEQLRKRRFSVFLVGADQMLIDAHEQFNEYWSGGPIVRLYWINSQGQIQREQELKLAGWTTPTLPEVAWSASVLAPISIVGLVGFVLVGPLILVQMNLMEDFGSAAALIANIAWLPLIVVVLLAALLAWQTLRLQRKYRRLGTIAWTTFVFLFGVPGFLAYLVEHRRAKLEACPQCGEIVPRDRDACAACSTEFAPPPRVGTEIFA